MCDLRVLWVLSDLVGPVCPGDLWDPWDLYGMWDMWDLRGLWDLCDLWSL